MERQNNIVEVVEFILFVLVIFAAGFIHGASIHKGIVISKFDTQNGTTITYECK